MTKHTPKPGENYEHDQPCTNPEHAGQSYAECGHTPGPWIVEGVCIVGPTNKMQPCTREDGTPNTQPSELIALVYGCDVPYNQAANARLIAQAPAMLEIIREALVLGWVDTLDARAQVILRAVDGE